MVEIVSVLRKKPEVVMDPYPHVVIENALPDDLYEALDTSYPSFDSIAQTKSPDDTQVFIQESWDSLKREETPALWKDFIRYHTSEKFYHDFLDVFGSVLGKEYRHVPTIGGKKDVRDFTVGMRDDGRGRSPHNKQFDIVLEQDFHINAPSYIKKKPVIHPHIDNPTKLFNGLLYMKEDGDDAGGDFLLYKVKPKSRVVYNGKAVANTDAIEVCKTVRYSRNTFVMFLNTEYAIHSATPRTQGKYWRRALNFSGECYRVRNGAGFFAVNNHSKKFYTPLNRYMRDVMNLW